MEHIVLLIQDGETKLLKDKTKHMITLELNMMEAFELAGAIRCRLIQIDRLFSITINGNKVLEGDEGVKKLYDLEKERLENILQIIKTQYVNA